MHQSVFAVPSLLVMIAPNKMKIAILSIVVCSILAVDAVPDNNVYGSNQVQFSHPQPINYHYPQPQPHYGSQPNYHGQAGFHPAPQPQQHHGANQFSEQYLVTAIKTDPAPPPVQYQQPSFKPESPFNGQSYIIEPSYLLKPFRPETSYHAQPYRPHNPPAPYPPTYQAPSYPSYQIPSYPAPVYNQAPAYQQQPYPAPVYQTQQTQSSVFLVYSTPLLAGYSTSTVTTIEPTKTVELSAVSPSQIQPVVETVVPGPAVKWSDILSADANELGQKYADKGKADKEVAKESEEDDDDEEKPSTTKESDSSSQPEKKQQQDNEGSQEQSSSSENANSQISYPIPANLASKAVWKIPKTVADYVQSGAVPDGSVDSVQQEVGDKKSPSRDSENEESSSKSSLTDYDQVGTENKESSETTTADQVTQVSLQGEPAKYEGRTQQHQVEQFTSSETPGDNHKEPGVVELVTPLQQEKPKSGSSVYYEQGPTIAGQEVVESKPQQEESNLESSTLYKEPVAEIISQPNYSVADNSEEEETGTEKSPVVYQQVDELQKVNYEAASYYQSPKSESPSVAAIAENPEVPIQVSPEEVSQLIYQLASLPGFKPSAESEETTDAAVEVSSERPTDPATYQSPEPALASLPDESQEIPDAATPSTDRPAYQTTYKPVIPRIYRPKVDSGEVEPPESDFGEKIKTFTKFALAVQKATHQGIYQQQSEPVRTAESISFTPSAPYASGEEVTQDNKSESVSTREKTSSENDYAPGNVNDELLKVQQPVSEPTYPAEGPTYEASLFYRKPVAPENEAAGPTTPPTAIQSELEFSTEGPYKFKPLFYAQAADKFTPPPPTAETNYEEPKLVQNVAETTGSYNGRIVAEKMSPDEPVQVINAFHQFVYTGPSSVPADSTSAPIIAQLPVLVSDPMEKTDNYATQRIYTASAEIPGDYVASSTPTYRDQNSYVTSTYAYIEEAGLSAEYQKEIASAQKEADYVAQTSAEGPYDQTETSNISQEEATDIPAVNNQYPSYETSKVKSTEETSAEVSYVTDSYQETTKSPSYEASVDTNKAKSAEVSSAEVIYAPVTDSPYYQEKTNAFSYEAAVSSSPKIKSAEEVSAEIVDAPATESAYPDKTSEAPAYDVVAPAITAGPAYDVVPHAAASAEDVSNEDQPVTDQYEATEYPADVSLTNYQAPAITEEFIPAVAPPRDIYLSTPAEPESSTLGGSSSESQETTSNQPETKSAQITDSSSYGTLLPTEIPLPPCHHSDKSDGSGHFQKFLFNPAALANVPLDSVETNNSGEDESTTEVPDVTTPVPTSNESTSAETSTVAAADGYKYVFKSRPTPNRFYESRSTTAIPSANSTTVTPPTSKRPFVIIGKPIEMRKPVNGRVYSRPSPLPQRKPQTLAQIKILPTRLRSSSSTLQLPNRRFFIGRTLMNNDKNNNQETSKEDEAKKDA
ncbi:flocculation protein FLO11-like isoform X2 [Daphnia pulex]|uniref:flocculation protein FLO11-like isoform X2 n=1 Tax=Daphnia pulex TaxID=6669 RepID=UPI001EDCA1C6|nr:flocculation protein FLO11-like isoform X2 [Daphnia pulex]